VTVTRQNLVDFLMGVAQPGSERAGRTGTVTVTGQEYRPGV